VSAGPPFDAVVLGAGANGLVASAALARAGMKVLVLERSDSVGGLARPLEFAPGFRASPLADDAGWLPPTVARGLGLVEPERAVSEASVSVVVERGDVFPVWRDPSRAADAIRPRSIGDAAKWPPFAARLRKLAGFLEALYQVPAPDVEARSFADLRDLARLAWKLRGLGREGMTAFLRTLPMSVQELLDDEFECAPLKAAVAGCGVEDIRQGPRSGGTAFVLLHHLVGASAGSVRGRGRWRAGPDAFVRSVEAVARSRGVVLRTGAAAARIVVKDDAVAGVVLEGGEEIAARLVLSTADPARTILGMVDPVWLDPEFLHALAQIKYRGCTAFVIFALEGLPELPGPSAREAEETLRGVVSLTPDLEALERAADPAKYGMASEWPHVEFTVPSLDCPALAPPGKHVLVARAQYAPYRLRDGATWDAARSRALADAVATAIEFASPGFSSRVLHRVVLTPRDLEERYALTEGAATHGEITLDQILFMRPLPGWSRYATPIRGLYWGGRGTHPGPGVLGGSGWLAAKNGVRPPLWYKGVRPTSEA
jgi:phytoene dehydrogenase-like protein